MEGDQNFPIPWNGSKKVSQSPEKEPSKKPGDNVGSSIIVDFFQLLDDQIYGNADTKQGTDGQEHLFGAEMGVQPLPSLYGQINDNAHLYGRTGQTGCCVYGVP